MGIKHTQFERNSMFDGTNEVPNRENLDATANITVVGLHYGLSPKATIGVMIPYKT